MFYIYVLKSLKNQKHYVGMTGQDPSQRLTEHDRGTSYWTYRNGPFRLIYQEQYADKEFARKREKFLKSGRGREFLKRKLTDVSLINHAGIAQW